MAATTQDYSKMINEMMSSFPVDMSSMQDSFKTYASFGEKMSRVALEAAGKSTELSSKWTRETISRMGDVTVARSEPSDYTKALTDFASSQAEMTAETMAEFAEVAKRVQMETVELMLAAGKDATEDMTAAAKKAGEEFTSKTQKATEELTSTAKKAASEASSQAKWATETAK